ncbi:hypothetical protein C1N73_34385 (plasmid) [Priestia aryabhattai]
MKMSESQKKEAMQAVFKQLELKLAKHVGNTMLRDREDVLQDVNAKIIEKAYAIFDEEPLGFFEYIEKEILKEELVL